MITSIQIDTKLKEKMDKLKIHHRETYNDLIARLLVNCSPNNEERQSLIDTIEILSDPETMREIAEALENYKKGEFIGLDDLKKELKLDV
ncbi:MAG: hypothetical protein WCP89_01580 [archaeon]